MHKKEDKTTKINKCAHEATKWKLYKNALKSADTRAHSHSRTFRRLPLHICICLAHVYMCVCAFACAVCAFFAACFRAPLLARECEQANWDAIRWMRECGCVGGGGLVICLFNRPSELSASNVCATEKYGHAHTQTHTHTVCKHLYLN